MAAYVVCMVYGPKRNARKLEKVKNIYYFCITFAVDAQAETNDMQIVGNS